MQKITPFLWFDTEAEHAASFYVSLFPDSSITHVSRYPAGGPMPEGHAFVVDFVLDGVHYSAMNAGPQFSFTEAISLYVSAETQDEIDRLWDALLADGGEPSRCGWLKDRWGLSWQVVPPVLGTLLQDPDPGRAARVMEAMMAMTKIDIAELQAAYDRE
ncbi:VOC family protein [Lacisediminihabitans changchengi]|uniref:VOC family protein n=1 Tax=Lacisediminihabitans changchengi TaxID=2787634 RepID=A0A934SRN8_9MICO|nr:VOC family protein [Lacisediminihabitans changchengi]MBK4347720.1 VOC family protein [Lacisediminihabitans changchengi]